MAKMKWGRRLLLPVFFFFTVLLSGRAAVAQDKVEEARSHFERGLQLYSEGAFEASLVEFERAYQLAPSYKILYNEARVHRVMNQYAEALTKFQRYLREGGDAIAPERRDEVEKQIEALRPRVATISIKTNVPGADVFVDDVLVGQSPVATAVIVNPGQRKISANKRGYLPATRAVRMVGSDAIEVALDLVVLSSGRQADKPRDPGPRNRAIIGWTATGALATGAVISGVLALGASASLEDAKKVPKQEATTLKSANSKLLTLSILTDAFTGAAVIAGGVSIYLTAKAVAEPDKPSKPKGPEVSLGIGPSSIAVSGRF
jgi:hypothetical protein